MQAAEKFKPDEEQGNLQRRRLQLTVHDQQWNAAGGESGRDKCGRSDYSSRSHSLQGTQFMFFWVPHGYHESSN